MKKNKSTRTRSRDDRKNSPFEDRKKFCLFSQKNSPIIDYKDVKLLRRFITDQGKIMPRRVTGTSAKMHRKLVRAIKQARNIALMPYSNISKEN